MGKFRIKIAPAWFSSDYIVIKYSTNGIFWKTVKNCEYDNLEERYYMVTMTSKFTNAEYLMNKFQTLEDILKFEEKERLELTEYNNRIFEINKKKEEERNSVYKKFG